MKKHDYKIDRVRNRARGYLVYRFFQPQTDNGHHYWFKHNKHGEAFYEEHRRQSLDKERGKFLCVPLAELDGDEIGELCNQLIRLGMNGEGIARIMTWWSGLVPEPNSYLYVEYERWPEVWK